MQLNRKVMLPMWVYCFACDLPQWKVHWAKLKEKRYQRVGSKTLRCNHWRRARLYVYIHTYIAPKLISLCRVSPPNVRSFGFCVEFGIPPLARNDCATLLGMMKHPLVPGLCTSSSSSSVKVSRPPSNSTTRVFAIKDDRPGDIIDTLRKGTELRPIGLKNADNKINGGVINGAVVEPFALSAVRIQRGLVRGRQIVDNVVELDAAARVQANEALVRGHEVLPAGPLDPMDIALLAFWDFASAFPSVAHSWLFACCHASGVPEGMICVIQMLYTSACIFSGGVDRSDFLCWLRSCIIQGCPLSGLLYAVCADPFLKMMVTDVVGPHLVRAPPSPQLQLAEIQTGVIRACADDIGGAFANLAAFARTSRAFSLAESFANLRLKGPKCVIVPTSHPCDPACYRIVREWLSVWAPQCSNFLFKGSSKYFGFLLGPAAGACQWWQAIAKFKARTHSIATSGAPPSIASLVYNIQSVSILGYISQLCHLPPSFPSTERGQLHALLHLPTNSATLSFFFQAKNGACYLSAARRPPTSLLSCVLRSALSPSGPPGPRLWRRLLRSA
jgi:hypothetical protein